PDGNRIDVAVGVPAGRAVDGADVEAGPAAEAMERLGQRAGELSHPTVVEDHEVQLAGAGGLARPARAPDQSPAGGERWPRRRPGAPSPPRRAWRSGPSSCGSPGR